MGLRLARAHTVLFPPTAAATACSPSYIFLVGFEELSTPFVNQRWFLDAAKMKDTVFFAVNGACLFIVFLFIRVPFAFIFYHVMVHRSPAEGKRYQHVAGKGGRGSGHRG